MRLHFLAPDGSTLFVSSHHHAPVSSIVLRDETGSICKLTQEDYRWRVLCQTRIISLIMKIAHHGSITKQSSDSIDEMLTLGFAFWLTAPEILEYYDLNANRYEGFIKVFEDHLECGWK